MAQDVRTPEGGSELSFAYIGRVYKTGEESLGGSRSVGSCVWVAMFGETAAYLPRYLAC